MTIDRENLKSWYRGAMARRLTELRDLRARLRAREASAYDDARQVAQSLRGSGATFGYPELSEVAGYVEAASDAAVLRRIEGLIEHVRGLAAEDGQEGRVSAEWLAVAAGAEPDGDETFSSLQEAWDRYAARSGLGVEDLAGRVAELLGLRVADLSNPSRAALRLVPEALIRSEGVLPVGEDSETIAVATADPSSLGLEMRLAQLTGRTPRFVVAPPEALRRGIAAMLDTQVPAGGTRPRPRATRPPSDAKQGQERVLVVDDEAEARLLARTVLEKGGYTVDEAGDGQEALERLGDTMPVALVVADLNMPRMDGLELIWEMRAEEAWAHVPVIVVTGESDEILETKLIEEGADDYIRKPLDPRLFLARVTATIRRTEP